VHQVAADVVQPARRVLPGLVQEHLLLEGRCGLRLLEPLRRPAHHHQVLEADLTGQHGLDAVGHLIDLLADRDPVEHLARVQVAADPHPVVGRVEAIAVVLVGHGKAGRVQRPHELEHVELLTPPDQALAQLPGRTKGA